MIFKEAGLFGAFVVEMEKLEDKRGFFGRAWCAREFEHHNIPVNILQCNVSFNKKKGTIRGMHYQVAPHEEVKLVMCKKGSIYDVIIDLRPRSATYRKWIGIELTDDNYNMLVVPKGCAHGYQTLVDNAEVFYMVSEYYSPSSEQGVRWNDEIFDIKWRDIGTQILSDKDRNWPDYDHN
jgi:dTDP-4-dehydrorhamnose 3,5-epimerase